MLLNTNINVDGEFASLAVAVSIVCFYFFIKGIRERRLHLLFKLIERVMEGDLGGFDIDTIKTLTVEVGGSVLSVGEVLRLLSEVKIKLTPTERIDITERIITCIAARYGINAKELRAANKDYDNRKKKTPVEVKVELLGFAVSKTLAALEGRYPWDEVINHWILMGKMFEYAEDGGNRVL